MSGVGGVGGVGVGDVVVDGVDKTFAGRPPVAALHDVRLTIPNGMLVAVLGPSGCGKTTLLRTIAGFERPDAGSVTLGGRIVSSPTAMVPPERRNVGIVPQEGALFPHLDVAGNIGFALRGLDRATRRARVGELLELVGLPGIEKRRPEQLSGGQQQRVAIARALAARPAVVLLDEPFAALDTDLRARVRNEVAAVLREAGATALLVTHDPPEALAVADRVAVMAAGRIVQQGTSRDLYRRPVDVPTARTLGDVVVLPAVADGAVAHCRLGAVALAAASSQGATPAPDGPIWLLLRPEQIVPRPDGPIEAVVRTVEFRGPDATVGLDIDGELVTARWSGTDAVSPGVVVRVAVAGEGVVVPGPA